MVFLFVRYLTNIPVNVLCISISLGDSSSALGDLEEQNRLLAGLLVINIIIRSRCKVPKGFNLRLCKFTDFPI
jgi:hypothetical protein